jgi:imidazolonepropionase-like amidohydrolase
MDKLFAQRERVLPMVVDGVHLVNEALASGKSIITEGANAALARKEAVREAKRKGLRICAHARSAESIKLCIKYGIEIIYHASFIDEEGLDLLEANKDKHFVAPGLAWLVQTCEAASDWGITPEIARGMGYVRELEHAIAGSKEMIKRGIRVLPGGDYGFAWTPHGTYARDLEYFVDLLGMSPMQAIVSATKLGGEIMLAPNELGLVKKGYLADLLLVDGDPSTNIAILQDGVFHKSPAPISASASVAA